MNFGNAVKYLESYVSYSDQFKVGYNEKNFNLPRIKDFLKNYRVDYGKLKYIHVAGSKGKGSTCLMIANYLKKYYKVGMFTSPHIVTNREDYWFNGDIMAKKKFISYVENLKKYIDSVGGTSLTCFELKVVIALKYFLDQKVDYAVLEVGLGGRLDATNIISPELAILTSVEKEHTEFLGNTISKILNEKLGIVKEKNGVPLLVGFQNPETKKMIKKKMKKREKVYFTDEIKCPKFKFKFENEALNDNAKVAYSGLKLLFKNVDLGVFEKSLREFRMLGRFQIEKNHEKICVFDIAHTENSMKNLVKSLKKKFPKKNFVFLISIMQGKDVKGILRCISGVAKKVVFTFSHSKRSIQTGKLLAYSRGFFKDVSVDDDAVSAYKKLLKDLKKDQVLVVTGSHFLVGKIFRKESLN